MTRKIQNKDRIGDKLIYTAKTPNGWSIVIMPDNILIDNYHIDRVHIHPDPKKHVHKVEISQLDMEKILETIKDYLNASNSFDVEELMEMLK
ncbi:hypothetical protein [Methanobrevibacter sp.]|uniref:hypothetical protein n=1 Tax=Methanobrevibacter sp. TaxID=66852 RepID=UPI00386A0118